MREGDEFNGCTGSKAQGKGEGRGKGRDSAQYRFLISRAGTQRLHSASLNYPYSYKEDDWILRHRRGDSDGGRIGKGEEFDGAENQGEEEKDSEEEEEEEELWIRNDRLLSRENVKRDVEGLGVDWGN
jgi:hypothetical protein